jgi:hypothetical protein
VCVRCKACQSPVEVCVREGSQSPVEVCLREEPCRSVCETAEVCVRESMSEPGRSVVVTQEEGKQEEEQEREEECEGRDAQVCVRRGAEGVRERGEKRG